MMKIELGNLDGAVFNSEDDRDLSWSHVRIHSEGSSRVFEVSGWVDTLKDATETAKRGALRVTEDGFELFVGYIDASASLIKEHADKFRVDLAAKTKPEWSPYSVAGDRR